MREVSTFCLDGEGCYEGSFTFCLDGGGCYEGSFNVLPGLAYPEVNKHVLR